MTSKRRAANEFAGFRLTDRALDEYADRRALTEDDLFRGLGRSRRAAPDALRPLRTAVVDESGLAYGEPISEGRTGLSGGNR